jgi:hypothetical protein
VTLRVLGWVTGGVLGGAVGFTLTVVPLLVGIGGFGLPGAGLAARTIAVVGTAVGLLLGARFMGRLFADPGR